MKLTAGYSNLWEKKFRKNEIIDNELVHDYFILFISTAR